MATMHPHWQSDDALPVPVHSAAPKASSTDASQRAITQPALATAKTSIRPVSRRPAAIIGIGIVLLVLFSYFQPGVGSETTGQAQNSFTFILGSDEPMPPSIVAAPGDEITFLNAAQHPMHIDLSDVPTYESIGRTPQIPFQGSFVTTIAADAQPGEYTFSIMGTDDTGIIYVENYGDENIMYPGEGKSEAQEGSDTSPDPGDLPEPQPKPGESSFEDMYSHAEETFDDVEDDAAQRTTHPPVTEHEGEPERSTAPQELPKNPFTVQYGQVHGAPLPPPYQGELIHKGAPFMPMQQPTTGAGEWIVIGLSAGTVLLVTRKAFRRV